MALPVSRNRTYSAASQVASVDLNDLQDQIIALHTKLYDPRTLILGADAVGPLESGTWTDSPDSAYMESASSAKRGLPINLDAGRQITAIRCRVLGHATSTFIIRLKRQADGTYYQLAEATSTLSATWQTMTLVFSPAAPVIITAGIFSHYRLWIYTTGAGVRFGQAEIDYEWAP